MLSNLNKYYLKPICPLDNNTGSLFEKKSESFKVQDIYFSHLELISKTKNKKITSKTYSFSDFKNLIDESNEICDLFNNLNFKNQKLENLLFKKKKISIFGILNLTPDSFSDGGTNELVSDSLSKAKKMIEDGANFIDIGGESTRPGADVVIPKDEIVRVMPTIQQLNFNDIDMSLDTRNSSTMELGILSGVKIINDVSALNHDENSIEVIKKNKVPIVVMHMPGNPKTMMTKIRDYDNVLLDVYDFLQQKIKELVILGVSKENIIADPGIGFGKDLDQNLILLKNLSIFHSLGVPLMLGVSRKRFIESISNESLPKKRVGGTISATLLALSQGIRIHRVHDVHEVYQAARVFDKLTNK